MDIPFAIGLLVITMASHGQVWYDGNLWQISGRGLLAVTLVAVIVLLSLNRAEWLIVACLGWSLSLAMGIIGFVTWRKGRKESPPPQNLGRRSRQ